MQRKLLTFASIPVLIFIIVVTAHLLGLLGNKEMFGFRYQFDYAQIRLPNGDIVEGEISAWARENRPTPYVSHLKTDMNTSQIQAI